MEEIILYSTHCPMCMALEMKLKQKKISYKEINDVEEIKKLGFSSVPILKVKDKFMNAVEAMNYVNNI